MRKVVFIWSSRIGGTYSHLLPVPMRRDRDKLCVELFYMDVSLHKKHLLISFSSKSPAIKKKVNYKNKKCMEFAYTSLLN